MAVLELNFNQLATVLNSIVSQATGVQQITPVDESTFISVAQTGLKCGYDPLMTAISQVLSQTIFSQRPYTRKLKGIEMSATRYGNHIRKLNIVDQDAVEDDRFKLVDGQSIDHYIVRKPKVVQTNYYGQNVFEDFVTIYKDQLDNAFSGSAQFGSFITMVMQNMTDKREKRLEEFARATVCNFIAGKLKCDAGNVVYLLDVYEDETGITLTAETYKDPQYFPAFAKWLKGYLTTLSKKMTERSAYFHKNFEDGSGNPLTIMRHTPMRNQKAYLFSAILDQIDSSVISDVYNKENMKFIDHEDLNFWQSLDTPQGIQVTPGYVDDEGKAVTSPDQVTLSNVFGVIFDEEAIGYNILNSWTHATPLNARGGYFDWWYHDNVRSLNDFSENGVVLIMDSSDRQLDSVTVTSEAGTQTGDTAITADPEPDTESGEYFAYKIGDAAQSVTYGMPVVTGWTAWNGTSEITAASGKVITVVIANAENRAIASGYATVVSAEE